MLKSMLIRVHGKQDKVVMALNQHKMLKSVILIAQLKKTRFISLIARLMIALLNCLFHSAGLPELRRNLLMKQLWLI